MRAAASRFPEGRHAKGRRDMDDGWRHAVPSGADKAGRSAAPAKGSFRSAPAYGQRAQPAFDGGRAVDGSSARTTPPRISAPPKVTTTAAPVGRSNLKDPHRPAIETVAPSVQ